MRLPVVIGSGDAAAGEEQVNSIPGLLDLMVMVRQLLWSWCFSLRRGARLHGLLAAAAGARRLCCCTRRVRSQDIHPITLPSGADMVCQIRSRRPDMRWASIAFIRRSQHVVLAHLPARPSSISGCL